MPGSYWAADALYTDHATLLAVAETPATSTAGPTTAAPAPASAPETTREPGHPPFSQILHQSLNREARSRAWCEESKSYEPLKQVPRHTYRR